MHILHHDLLVLRQHLRSAVASLQTMVLDPSPELPESQHCLLRSLGESARQVRLVDRRDKDDDLDAVWRRFTARFDRFREAADTAYDLLDRWKADERTESFQAAAAHMAEHLFPAHQSAMGLLNHMITVVAFDWPVDRPTRAALASESFGPCLGGEMPEGANAG